jgi:CheY-like chemotaxis protein
MGGPGRIEIRLSALPGGQAALEVIDTGCGMAPEVLRHAMEPFFTARRDGTGTGLGLAMVYGFIRQSGGDLQIASEVGQGTTVRLILPCLTPGAQGAPLPWARVLVVEDDAADMARARAILSDGGAAVEGCASPEAAAARLARDPAPDLLLTDLHLGGAVAGWDLAARALDAHPGLRVIVASGRMPGANPLAARHAARVVCLTKPLTPAALAAAGRSLHA